MRVDTANALRISHILIHIDHILILSFKGSCKVCIHIVIDTLVSGKCLYVSMYISGYSAHLADISH